MDKDEFPTGDSGADNVAKTLRQILAALDDTEVAIQNMSARIDDLARNVGTVRDDLRGSIDDLSDDLSELREKQQRAYNRLRQRHDMTGSDPTGVGERNTPTRGVADAMPRAEAAFDGTQLTGSKLRDAADLPRRPILSR